MHSLTSSGIYWQETLVIVANLDLLGVTFVREILVISQLFTILAKVNIGKNVQGTLVGKSKPM